MTKRRQPNYDPNRTSHTPLNVQRSDWKAMGDGIPMPDRPGEVTPRYERNVHDGRLTAFAADESIGWHMSISFVDHRGNASRYPTWDEIMHARTALLPADLAFVIRFPADTEGYVAAHMSTFHLHEQPDLSVLDDVRKVLATAIDARDLLVQIADDDDLPHRVRNEARTTADRFDKALGS